MFRRCVLLALAVLLAACGRDDARAPFTESRLPPALDQRGWPPPSWTWGLIRIGRNPAQRYGVGAPRVRPRGHILILPGYGEPAEAEFPTIADFIARGYVVWALEGVGQGGSGRIVIPRDLGYVGSFAGDVDAVRALSAQAIRPRGATFVVIARGTAAPLALRAVQQGVPGLSGLVLVAPRLTPPGVETATSRLERALGLGGLRVAGAAPWRRVAPAADASAVDQAAYQWQLANPDLRMGGPSLAWLAAFGDLTRQVDAAGWKAVRAPVLVVLEAHGGASGDQQRLCRALPKCEAAGDKPDATARFVERLTSVQPNGEF